MSHVEHAASDRYHDLECTSRRNPDTRCRGKRSLLEGFGRCFRRKLDRSLVADTADKTTPRAVDLTQGREVIHKYFAGNSVQLHREEDSTSLCQHNVRTGRPRDERFCTHRMCNEVFPHARVPCKVLDDAEAGPCCSPFEDRKISSPAISCGHSVVKEAMRCCRW
jgi:hypothetical protein